MKPVVAIVGRPNVGKSALFNRILGVRRAIIKDEPGVTRDINYADCEELGHPFTLIDTGGFEPKAKEEIVRKIREQTSLAIEEADVIVFLMDGRVGPSTSDKEIAGMLRKSGKKVIYAANKIDTQSLIGMAGDFYSLGAPEILPVSAEHGLGLAELMDKIIEYLPEYSEEEEEAEQVKVALVGRPNAGKSSLLNKFIGRERSIVSEVAGTTRDSIDTSFEHDDKNYLLIDTAGIRRKGRISRRLETYCVVSAIRSIERCDVALLVADGMEGLRAQDERIAGLVEDRGKCCVVVVNKWDLVEKNTNTAKEYTEKIRELMPFLAYAPVVFVSALTGRRALDIFKVVERVREQANRKLQTATLNELLRQFTTRHHPPVYRGKPIKFYYMTQTGTAPQRLRIFTNYPMGVPMAYRRYLINRFREALDIGEVPLRVSFRSRR